MLQKDMVLKQKRNLDPIKGNPFATLSLDSLNQIANVASVKIGLDTNENCKLINNLVQMDKEQYEQFAGANPETLLPDNLDIEISSSSVPVEGK
jgi:hypothetical protein